MKTFYQKVDLSSRSEMIQFLLRHLRYDTMNSWNRSTSYACNLKLHRLGLDAATVEKLYDMLDTQEFFDSQQSLRQQFGIEHDYRWQVGMNGRSGGYLVLYQGEVRTDGDGKNRLSVIPVGAQMTEKTSKIGLHRRFVAESGLFRALTNLRMLWFNKQLI